MTDEPTTTTVERVLLVGDTHANVRWARHAIDRAGKLGVDLVLQLGDFGYWPRFEDGRRFLAGVEAECAAHDLPLWFIDGNHEDHVRLASTTTPPGPVALTDHVMYVPRGTRWQWGTTRWLAVGGASSVDRGWRTDGIDWFAEEFMTPEQQTAIEQAGPADVVVAHDAPWGVPFLTTRLNQTTPPEDRGDWPADALTDSDAHQRRLRAVAEAVRPRQWYHGHHHVRYDDRVPTPWGGFDIHGLDCDGSTWDNGTVLVGADGTIVG